MQRWHLWMQASAKGAHIKKMLQNTSINYTPGGVESVELLSLSNCTFRDAFVSGISMVWVSLVA